MTTRATAHLVLISAVLMAACITPEPDTSRHTDIVYWNGIYYQAPFGSTGRALSDEDLGPEQFRVNTRVERGTTPLTDRDAGWVPAGSPVFAVVGYRTSFRLAARHDGRLFLYESAPNAAAKRGADLLDIEGRVVAIALLSSLVPESLVTRLDDRTRVDELVHLVSVAPVDLSGPWGVEGGPGKSILVSFELADGTRTVRGYNRVRRVLSDVIYVGAEFKTAIESLISASPCSQC